MSFPTGAGNFHSVSLHGLEIGLVNMGLLMFILGVCFSDAVIDFTANVLCPEVSKVASKEKS